MKRIIFFNQFSGYPEHLQAKVILCWWVYWCKLQHFTENAQSVGNDMWWPGTLVPQKRLLMQAIPYSWQTQSLAQPHTFAQLLGVSRPEGQKAKIGNPYFTHPSCLLLRSISPRWSAHKPAISPGWYQQGIGGLFWLRIAGPCAMHLTLHLPCSSIRSCL